MTAHGAHNESQLPLRGVQLCCTAVTVEQRSRLAAIVQEMGGLHQPDLTSDVTHLIAMKSDTPKYKYVARERPDVKVVTPEWLEAVRESWLEGGETDVAALEEQHRLPTFPGLQISITGITDVEGRGAMEKAINENGATFHGDLTKRITHLIAAAPQGRKYEHALQWGIKIVSAEWLRDCLERRMVLDEGCYNPLVPPEQRGKGATLFNRELTQPLGKRARQDDSATDSMDFGRRKLRRTASAKLGSQSDGIWADIESRNPGSTKHENPEWNDQIQDDQHGEKKNLEHSSKPSSGSVVENQVVPKDGESLGVFQRLQVFIAGFDERQTAILQKFLEGNGAHVLPFNGSEVSTDTAEVFCIVPHDMPLPQIQQMLPQYPAIGPNPTLVTDLWVERCLHDHKYIDPKTDVLCRPLKMFPLDGFASEVICPTSFQGVHRLHMSKVVRLLGARYDETLNSETTILVCSGQSPTPMKIDLALKLGIPIVTESWLKKSLELSEKQPLKQHLLVDPLQMAKSPSYQSGHAETIRTGNSDSITEQARPRHPEMRHRPRTAPANRSIRGRLELVQARRLSRPASDGAEVRLKSFTASDFDKHNEGENDGHRHNTDPAHHEPRAEPLSDIEPAVNSPTRRSQGTSSASAGRSKDDNVGDGENCSVVSREATPLSTEATLILPVSGNNAKDPRGATQALNENIAMILAKKRQANNAEEEKAGALRHRPLGRAVSNPSSVNAASRSSSLDAHKPYASASEEELAEEFGHRKQLMEVLPSQVLSYEDPDAEAVRERLMKRMGIDGTHDQHDRGMKRVESIGLVKDGGSGVAQRVANRRKAAKKR